VKLRLISLQNIIFIINFNSENLILKFKMTTPRSKSPKPQNSFRKDDVKDETTFWDKIGTLGRKKRIKEGKYFNITLYGHHQSSRVIVLINMK